jgi:hypothetical protein
VAGFLTFFGRKWKNRKANFLNMAVFPLQEAFIAWKRVVGKGPAYVKIINKSEIMKNLPK